MSNRLGKMCCVLVIVTLSPLPAKAEWVSRTVTSVDGIFSNFQPAFGYEVGLGTSHIEWGVPLPGSFTSSLEFQGYDAFPGFSQPWFYPGQTVMPGQTFLAGTLTFRNGSLSTTSSASNLSVDLNASAFGGELDIDNHPFQVDGTWNISVVQTPNFGVDPVADADYIYFTDFPNLGTFRVFEGRSTYVEVLGKFGSLDPAGFGAVGDPTAGIVLPLANSVPEPSSITLVMCSFGCFAVRRLTRKRGVSAAGL